MSEEIYQNILKKLKEINGEKIDDFNSLRVIISNLEGLNKIDKSSGMIFNILLDSISNLNEKIKELEKSPLEKEYCMNCHKNSFTRYWITCHPTSGAYSVNTGSGAIGDLSVTYCNDCHFVHLIKPTYWN